MTNDDHSRPLLRVIDGGPHAANASIDAHLTIADVAAACGLPQPVTAQLVPRTWTADGWMYTPAQLEEAVRIARRRRSGDGDGIDTEWLPPR